jgi:hypothetical protein
MSEDLIRIRTLHGSDEINAEGRSFRPRSDGSFFVTRAMLPHLTSGVAGFFLAPMPQHSPAVEAATDALVEALSGADPQTVRETMTTIERRLIG